MKEMFKIKFSFLIIFCLIISSCDNNTHFTENKGSVFGTYYSIIYESDRSYASQFDSIFTEVNNAVSDYQNDSEISQLNRNGELNNPSEIVLDQLKSTSYYSKLTDGAFEPTLKPLIDAWGFGTQKRKSLTQAQVDSILNFVSFQDYVEYNDTFVKMKKDRVVLSLTALGEGYTLNQLAKFLSAKGVKNYKVEIGGEVKCKGNNSEGNIWRIGIQNPSYVEDNTKNQLLGIVTLHNTSLSTSGSYRKYYLDSLGEKKPHIIDPKTGYPVDHNLLSVSIKCEDAEKADAMATACMAMGTDKAKAFILSQEDIDGYLIFDSNKDSLETWSSPGFLKSMSSKVISLSQKRQVN